MSTRDATLLTLIKHRPLAMVQQWLTADLTGSELDASSECFRLMLEADADVFVKDSGNRSIFEQILSFETPVSSNDYPRAF